MELTIHRDSLRRDAQARLVVVRDADGTWQVMDGVLPVVSASTGQWLHDGAGSDTSVTEAPHWLVALLAPEAPEDWRQCRFELRSLAFSRPGAPSRDDCELLEGLGLALKTEREARQRAEEELRKHKGDADGEGTTEGDAGGAGAAGDRQGKEDDARRGAGGKRKAAEGARGAAGDA